MEPEQLKYVDEANESEASALTEMPAYTEHMKNFENARRSNEVPEGVRDEQDYMEYREETGARLREAIDFINQNFRSNFDVKDEEVDEFLNSKDLMTVVKNGISMEDLASADLIDTEMPPIDVGNIFGGKKLIDGRKAELFSGAGGVIDIIGSIAAGIEVSSGKMTQPLKEIIRKRKAGETLNAENYSDADGFFASLRDRIMFGSPFDKNNRFQRTAELLEKVDEITSKNLGKGELYVEVMRRLDDGYIEDKDGILADRLGRVCRKNMPEVIKNLSLYEELDWPDEFSEMKQLILRSSDREAIIRFHNEMEEAGVSESEMLGAAYYFEDRNKSFTRLLPDYYLARHLATLEEAGFSRDSIIDKLHDNKVRLSLEEIEDMRKDGVSDVDIAYAGRIFDHVFPKKGDESWEHVWATGDWHKAGFSERTALMAALKEIKNK